jgi:hypothetical protein
LLPARQGNPSFKISRGGITGFAGAPHPVAVKFNLDEKTGDKSVMSSARQNGHNLESTARPLFVF